MDLGSAVEKLIVAVTLAKGLWERSKDKDVVSSRARSVIHTCTAYENALRQYVQAELKLAQVAPQSPSSAPSNSPSQSPSFLAALNEDGRLLDGIIAKAHEVAKQSWWVQYVVKSDTQLAEFEQRLSARSQALQLAMIQNLHDDKSKQEEYIFTAIRDYDAGLFWKETIGTVRTCTLKQLVIGLEKWLQTNLGFGLIPGLRHILSSTMITHSQAQSNPDLMQVTITVEEWGAHMKRYGPLRGWYQKTSALVSADGYRLPMFRGEFDRLQSETFLLPALKSTAPITRVEDCMVIRYSANGDFVLSMRVANPIAIKHFVVWNHDAGYHLDGDNERFYANLLDLIQEELLNLQYPNLKLNTAHIDAWAACAKLTPPSAYIGKQPKAAFTPDTNAGGIQAILNNAASIQKQQPTSAARGYASAPDASTGVSSPPSALSDSGASLESDLLTLLRRLNATGHAMTSNQHWSTFLDAAESIMPGARQYAAGRLDESQTRSSWITPLKANGWLLPDAMPVMGVSNGADSPPANSLPISLSIETRLVIRTNENDAATAARPVEIANFELNTTQARPSGVGYLDLISGSRAWRVQVDAEKRDQILESINQRG